MKKQKIKKKSKKFLYKNRKRSNQNNYVLSVCVVWKYHWMVKFRLPNSVVFENYTMLLLRHTRLWSMMNALCQINRNVRKKTLLSIFISNYQLILLLKWSWNHFIYQMLSNQWSIEAGRNRITEYRSFGIIYRTEPNNTEPNHTLFKSSNLQI